MSDENDVVLRVGNKELVRVTIPGMGNRVAVVNATFLPGDNRKLQDFTVQLGGPQADDEATVVESHGVIGFAPNPGRVTEDDDDLDPDEED